MMQHQRFWTRELRRHILYLAFVLSFYSVCCAANPLPVPQLDATPDQLIFLQAAWRHGDRSPTKTFKSDINQEDKWEQGWGQLTPRGMAQHVTLGKKLRERYIKELKFINGTYKNPEIYVRSTDVNRTLTSAISNLIGFYGEGARKGTDYPDIAEWPSTYIPIAVHTVENYNDHIGNPDAVCPRQQAIKKLWLETPEYKDFMEKKKGFFENLTKFCEEEVNPSNFWVVADALYIEDLWNKKRNDWVTPELLNEINETNWLLEAWANGERMKPYKGFDFSVELPKIRGGGLLWDMIGHMKTKIDCLKQYGPNGSNKENMSSLCKWANQLKYNVYSVHDTTLAALFASFGFNKTNYDVDGFPHYSASVTVELWQRADDSTYVKVLYWIPGKEKVVDDVTKDIVGCGNECSLDDFAKRSLPYKAEPNPEDFCQNTNLGDVFNAASIFTTLPAMNLLGLLSSVIGLQLLYFMA
ncbi:histidine phosphatase superfamily (branch 2) domain-containing protein [Ditylenchus destructor]|nr:histidine phosphatase superfamily (branch 2) domain-containing protein [Ditylenchus destructor]